ncbi:MAG TPA: YdeI/OmpD-associated family protein [Candidatus Thermoplasmatota archaeon]|nr:YdeI/OmpD-associated family protein [Candidatus Thermoplasmatota archaeon]
MEPRFFGTQAQWRRWLAKHHAAASELVLGFYKAAAGRKGITYQQALDVALCFGWIDGVRRSLGDEAWSIRFTPRRPRSIWSAVNLRRAEKLKAEGKMAAAGLAAFEGRDPTRAGLYSFENKPKALAPAYERALRADARAWEHWSASPPGYRRTATFWVMSAKREKTRERRAAQLIRWHSEGKRIPSLTSPTRKKAG